MILRLEEQQTLDQLRFGPQCPAPFTQVQLNWVSEQGGLPRKIEQLKKDLERKGHDTSGSVAIAVEAAKRFCAKGHKDWCGAVAEWEKMKARANAS